MQTYFEDSPIWLGCKYVFSIKIQENMWTGTQTFIDTCDMSDSKVAAVRIMEGEGAKELEIQSWGYNVIRT